jgi:SAM-dependent methyltransferase
MLRSIYYWLPPSLRLLARRLVFLPHDLMTAGKRRGELLPPRGIIFTGSGDFLEDGKRWTEHFKHYGLQPSDAFLDIGSGIGRIAVGLTHYLNAEAKYEGFDIMALGVNWCRNNISKRHPQFRFTLIDLKNDLYRNTGDDASQLTFPYGDNHFEMACATSLFTHLLPDETANYLIQTGRCLKPGGKLVATFFLKDPNASDDKAQMDFKFDKGRYALHSEQSQAANVRYDLELLTEMADKAGLKIETIDHGHWRGTPKGQSKDFQDIVVMTKP